MKQQLKDSAIKNQIGEFQDIQNRKPSEVAMMNEIKRLKSEVTFLNNINTRIGKELAKNQVKLGIKPGSEPLMGEFNEMKDKANLYNQKAGTFSSQEISFLEPLFLAYDDKLDKMESMLSTVYEDVKEMEKKSEELIDENTFLRNELETKCENIMTMHKNGGSHDENMATAFQKLEFQDLKERLYLMTEENSELLNKYKEISTRYDTMKSTLDNKIKSHDDLYKDFLEQQNQVKNFEIQIENTRHQRDVLENKLKNFGNNIVQEQSEKSDITSKYSKALNEIKLLKAQVTNQKRQNLDFEEKKIQEIEMLVKDLESTKLKERESFNKVIFIERELDSMKEENRKIKKDLDQRKNDCDQMIRMMENYENKVQSFQKKEENMTQLFKDQREKVQEAQLEKDKAQLKEQQLEKTLESQQQKMRDEFGQQKDQYEKIIQSLRSKNKTVVEEKEQELQDIQEQLVQIQLQSEKQNREFQSLKEENSKLQTFLKEDLSGQHDQEIADKERRINELEEKFNFQEQISNEKIHTLNLDKQQTETNLKNLQHLHQDLKSQLEQTRNKNSQVSSEMQGLKSRLNTAVREKQSVLDEISKIKKHYETKLEYGQEEYNNKIRDLVEQNQQSINREKASRTKAIELLQNHDRMEDKMRFEYESQIKELEQKVLSLKGQIKVQSNKLNDANQNRPQREYM